jgi:hypothetical protein
MSKPEVMTAGMVLGFVPPIFLGLTGGWLSIPLVPEHDIWKYALMGFLVGIGLDAVVLPRWVRAVYRLNATILVSLYVFYTIGIFGFFMGVPIFNLLPGIAAGLYIGRRLRLAKADAPTFTRSTVRICRFTTCVMFVVCLSSATLALLNPSTGSDLKRMLGLGFQVTRPMIVALIVAGGSMLVAGQYWLTRLSARLAFQYPKAG